MAFTTLLLEKRKNIAEQSKALLDKAETEKRGLTVEEQTAYDQHSADLVDLRKQVEKLEEQRKEAEAFDAVTAGLPKVDARNAPTEGRNVVGEELRAFVDGKARTFEVKDAHHELRSMVNEPVGAHGRREVALRALSRLSAAAGQNIVPTTFYGKLWANLILTAQLINAGATVWTTDSGEQIQVPITTGFSTGSLVAEAGTIGASDPAFGQRALGAFKYGTLFQVSKELLQDTGIDLEAFLAMQAGRAVGNALGADLVAGNGTAKPSGILQTAANGVTGQSGVAGAPSFDNLMDLYYSVLSPYRSQPEAAWLLNDTTQSTIRKLKDSTGRYLWEPTLTPQAPDQILGKPVVSDPNMPTVALGAKSVLFGDLSSYVVRIVNGVRFERSDDFAFNADLATYKCVIRGDGLLVDQTAAVKTFTGNAA